MADVPPPARLDGRSARQYGLATKVPRQAIIAEAKATGDSTYVFTTDESGQPPDWPELSDFEQEQVGVVMRLRRRSTETP